MSITGAQRVPAYRSRMLVGRGDLSRIACSQSDNGPAGRGHRHPKCAVIRVRCGLCRVCRSLMKVAFMHSRSGESPYSAGYHFGRLSAATVAVGLAGAAGGSAQQTRLDAAVAVNGRVPGVGSVTVGAIGAGGGHPHDVDGQRAHHAEQ